MNINLVSYASIPHSSAESIHIVLTAESLAQYCDVVFYSPVKIWRVSTFSKSLKIYDIENPTFRYKKIVQFHPKNTLNLLPTLMRGGMDAVFYCRQGLTTRFYYKYGKRVVWELHALPSNQDFKFLKKAILNQRFIALIVITHSLKEDVLKVIGEQYESKIHVIPDAADVRRFVYSEKANTQKKKIGYIGSNYEGKGYEIIKDLIHLVDNKFHMYGFESMNTPNAVFHGRIPYAEVPAAMETFDIGLLPNQLSVKMISGGDIGKYTSPMKMFEYMAAGKVIIASDIPVIREVLTDNVNALLVPHDNPIAWKEAIIRLSSDSELFNRLKKQAREDVVQKYSYDNRSKRILEIIHSSEYKL